MRAEEVEEEEEESNWFARWEEQLPLPEELTPLSQSLITPNLALAFDIPTAAGTGGSPFPSNHHQASHLRLHSQPQSSSIPSSDFDTYDLNSAYPSASSGPDGNGDEPARTLKRPRLVWTPQLHRRFVDAVAHLGIKNAVPKTIMQLMSVDGLTRENVASHLQKYRQYLKRMQGLTASDGGTGGPVSAADAATDQLFASTPAPHHFLAWGAVRPPGIPAEPFLIAPVTARPHHHQINTAAAMQQQQQQQFYHQKHVGHFGSPTAGAGFNHGFLDRVVQQQGMHRITRPAPGMGLGVNPLPSASSYLEDVAPARRGNCDYSSKKVLTLFPTGED